MYQLTKGNMSRTIEPELLFRATSAHTVLPAYEEQHLPTAPARARLNGLGDADHSHWHRITFPDGRQGRTHNDYNVSGLQGLGFTPAHAVGIAAAIGALAAVVQNEMMHDWTERTVFTSHARKIHASMLGIQCILGGASGGDITDLNGNVVCPAGTKPICTIQGMRLVEWRALRDNFGQFWGEVAGKFFGPTEADAQLLKGYARHFDAFYQSITPLCRAQGAELVPPASLAEERPPDGTPGWIKWSVAGVGFIAVLSLASVVKGIFREWS